MKIFAVAQRYFLYKQANAKEGLAGEHNSLFATLYTLVLYRYRQWNECAFIKGSATNAQRCFVYHFKSSELDIGYFAVSKQIVKGRPSNKAIASLSNKELVIIPYAWCHHALY